MSSRRVVADSARRALRRRISRLEEQESSARSFIEHDVRWFVWCGRSRDWSVHDFLVVFEKVLRMLVQQGEWYLAQVENLFTTAALAQIEATHEQSR